MLATGVQFLHPTIRCVRLLKTERKGSESTQAVYFCVAKVFSAEFFSKSQYAYVGLWRSRWHTQCNLWVRRNQVKFAEFDERLILFSEGEFLSKDSWTMKQPASKTDDDCGSNSSLKVASRPSDEETTLHNKIDLLMGLVQDMAPVVKTLQEVHEASLLYDEDEDAPVESASDSGEHEVDESPRKRPKSDLGTQSSSPKTGESTTATEVTEDEVTRPAISEKIASVLNNILASGLNEQATKRRKENIHRPSNSKLLTQTRVNPEIWDIAKKQTRSMDSRLQAL